MYLRLKLYNNAYFLFSTFFFPNGGESITKVMVNAVNRKEVVPCSVYYLLPYWWKFLLGLIFVWACQINQEGRWMNFFSKIKMNCSLQVCDRAAIDSQCIFCPKPWSVSNKYVFHTALKKWLREFNQ